MNNEPDNHQEDGEEDASVMHEFPKRLRNLVLAIFAGWFLTTENSWEKLQFAGELIYGKIHDGAEMVVTPVVDFAFGLFYMDTDISSYDCQKVADLFDGFVIENMFGAQFEVLAISSSSLTLISKTEDEVLCTGEVMLSDGRTVLRKMNVEKGPNGEKMFYGIGEP